MIGYGFSHEAIDRLYLERYEPPVFMDLTGCAGSS
nr:MAG TPA: hypothetical protein [Caudoviricetes sp.]